MRNNIDAADYLTVSFHTTQISDLETGKQDKLTFDTAPTAGSSNPVTSAGIKTAIDGVGAEVSALKSAVDTNIGSETRADVTLTYTDGYQLKTTAPMGSIIEAATYSISQNIDLTNAKGVVIYWTGQNPYSAFGFYKANGDFIQFASPSISSTPVEYDVPDNASYGIYSTMTSRENVTITIVSETKGAIYTELDKKLDTEQGAENAGKVLAVGEDGNVTPITLASQSRPAYGKSRPSLPLFPEMVADFAWCSMLLPAAFTGHNVVLTVSGASGATDLTVSAITGATMADMSSFTPWIGGVLSTDGKAFTVYNFKYKDANTVTIFPALTEAVTNAELSTLMYDSGESYTGLHLTENGYKAYAYHLYNTNPRHCEASKYIAAYRPYIDNEPNPLTKFGSATTYSDVYTTNRTQSYINYYVNKVYRFLHSTSYASSDSKTGVSWDVDLKGKSGYFEAYVNPLATTFDVDAGKEVYVDVYIDGTLASQTILSNVICKRICVDYENADAGRVEIYCNHWENGVQSGFAISRLCWWVNELEYGNTPLFPKGAVIGQEFDSWGVFHDGASGVALSTLHNDATGVTVPYENHSLGNQTSAWGKAWWYENVWKYHPSIAVTDFVVNDGNSESSASIPATIEGPDGKTYNNHLTTAQYAENQKCIIDEALNNGIQPIIMRASRGGFTVDIKFTLAMIDALAEQVE